MKSKWKQLLAACALLLTIGANGQIVNGTFDQNNPGYGWYCGAPYGWTVDIAQWENQWNNNGDTWWVDITGCDWGNGHWIEQTVATIPGHTYYLSFQLGCWNGQCFTDAGADLYIDGSYVNHYAHTNFSGSQLAWATFTHCFTASGTSTTIRFVGNGAATYATPGWANPISNFVGVIGLDNVELTDLSRPLTQSTCAPTVLTAPFGATASWYFNGSFIGTGTSIAASTPGTYQMTWNSPCGMITGDITIIDCSEPCEPEIDFTITNKDKEPVETLCVGEPYIFTGIFGLAPNATYHWDFGDGTATSPSSNPQEQHVFSQPGIYEVCLYVTIQAGPGVPEECVGKEVKICKTIVVVNCSEPDPCAFLLDFTIRNDKGKPQETYCVGQKIHFEGFSTTGAPLNEFTWEFGDGTIAGPSPNPHEVHGYSQPGTYVVCLTARILPGPGVPKACEGKLVRVCKTIIIKNCKPDERSSIQGSSTMQLPYPMLSVSPNPATDVIAIGGLMREEVETVLSLYDISGTLVLTQVIEPGKAEARLNVKELGAGVYLMKLEGKEYRQEIRIVKE